MAQTLIGIRPLNTRILVGIYDDGDTVMMLGGKKFFLLDTQLTAEDEELTPTMKLKRKLVQQKYAPQIEAMYR